MTVVRERPGSTQEMFDALDAADGAISSARAMLRQAGLVT
ncbi:MAG: hypothetical protein QOE61_1078 [Micromonosporaceae bacterium]|jgi:hypothetical protein|nr:hypothetical protein [Micromonosporaceae bacterium]